MFCYDSRFEANVNGHELSVYVYNGNRLEDLGCFVCHREDPMGTSQYQVVEIQESGVLLAEKDQLFSEVVERLKKATEGCDFVCSRCLGKFVESFN